MVFDQSLPLELAMPSSFSILVMSSTLLPDSAMRYMRWTTVLSSGQVPV